MREKKILLQDEIYMIDMQIKLKSLMLCSLENKVILDSVIKYIRNTDIDIENIISDIDIEIIYEGMDKIDYRIDYGYGYGYGYDRWLDLNKLITRIINLKNKYRDLNLVLKKVRKLICEDRLPPTNNYSLEFESDKEKIIFNL